MRRPLCLILAASLGLAAIAGRAAAAGDDAAILADLDRSLTSAEQRLGGASPELLPILAPLAQLRFRGGDIRTATALRRRSLAIAVAAFGGASPQAARAMLALAELHLDLYRFLDAEPLLILARNALAAASGATSPALAPVLSGLARVALARGNKRRAVELARRAVRLEPAAAGPLRALGAALAAAGAYSEAEQVLRAAIAAARRNDGERGLAAARSLAALGEFYLRRKRFAAALRPIEEATAIDQAELAPDHPLIAADFHDLGIAYLGLGRARLAAAVTQAAVKRLDRPGERDSPQFGYTLIELAHAEHALGRDDRAKRLLAQARDILRTAVDAERQRERRI